MIALFKENDMKTKRFDLFVIMALITLIFITGCSTNSQLNNNANTVDNTEHNGSSANETTTVASQFVGKWKCLRANSCNDKEIVLTISQDGDTLNIVRDMESYSSSGSKITFSVPVPDGDSFESSNTRATYKLSDGILTETFQDDKVNYYSATGQLPNRICQFPFCSEVSGDSANRKKHDTEEGRYNSLTDSQKRSICYFIKGRYEYYDSINGGYAGDKYSNAIMAEAAEKYGLSIEHLKVIWLKFYEY